MQFIGVRCVCGMFQVIQEPKSKKFDCRVCGERKQSVRKVYARSPRASDVRGVIQQLNMTAGALEELGSNTGGRDVELDYGVEGEPSGWEEADAGPIVSRWSAFVENDRTPGGYEDEAKFVTELPPTAGGVKSRAKNAKAAGDSGEADDAAKKKRGFGGPSSSVLLPTSPPTSARAPVISNGFANPLKRRASDSAYPSEPATSAYETQHVWPDASSAVTPRTTTAPRVPYGSTPAPVTVTSLPPPIVRVSAPAWTARASTATKTLTTHASSVPRAPPAAPWTARTVVTVPAASVFTPTTVRPSVDDTPTAPNVVKKAKPAVPRSSRWAQFLDNEEEDEEEDEGNEGLS